VEGVAVDREGVLGSGDDAKHAVFVRAPLGEAREPLPYALAVGVEDVGAVAVHQDAVGVEFVVGIAGDVWTLVADSRALTGGGQFSGDDAASVTRADDQGRATHFPAFSCAMPSYPRFEVRQHVL